MSNRAHLEYIEFRELDDDLKPTGEASVGFRVYDDYGEVCSCFPGREEMRQKLAGFSGSAPVRAVKLALACEDTEIFDLLAHVRINQAGMYVNGVWHDWEDIHEAFEEEQKQSA